MILEGIDRTLKIQNRIMVKISSDLRMIARDYDEEYVLDKCSKKAQSILV